MARTARNKILFNVGVGFGLLLSGLVGVASCGGSTGESQVSPCATKLSCGQPCSSAMACGQGQYCGADAKCTADCLVGESSCGPGKTCNGSGRCVAGIDLGGLGGSESMPGGGGGGGVCASTDVDLTHQMPTVLLLVDQSGSMKEKFGASDRWQTLRTALMDPAAGIVPTLQAQVRFGLSLYSGRNGQAPCPTLTNVAPLLNNAAPIGAAYPVPTSAIIDDTPTGESIDAAVVQLQKVTEPGPKVIVLATDGEPDTCADPDSGNGAPAKEVAIKAAQDAFAVGIFTFYISVGSDISAVHAREMANVGQGFPRTDPKNRFYLANDQKALGDAFSTIVNGVRNCSFQLNGTVKAGSETLGNVTLDGVALPVNGPNGWRLSSPTTIELVGGACTSVKDEKDHKVSAKFPCGSIVPFKPPV